MLFHSRYSTSLEPKLTTEEELLMIKISDLSIVFFRDSFKRQLSTLASLTPTVELIRPSNQDHKKTTLSISISFLWSHPQRLSVFMIMLKSLPTSQTHD